ncbi:MAG: Holliday junction resolvase RuvX [Flavobacteriaceae bacterium]|nr:Holliday junction resolvase RuvX [Flavobacteriaceae bacterium]
MAKIMALDFGMKRTGIAISDDLKMIASGLKTVETKELMSFLEAYIPNEQVDTLVVGAPFHTDGTPTALETNISYFIEDFSTLFPNIKIERIDERFTSKMAVQSMIDGGMKKKKRREKGAIDQMSATIILQSYMYN